MKPFQEGGAWAVLAVILSATLYGLKLWWGFVDKRFERLDTERQGLQTKLVEVIEANNKVITANNTVIEKLCGKADDETACSNGPA